MNITGILYLWNWLSLSLVTTGSWDTFQPEKNFAIYDIAVSLALHSRHFFYHHRLVYTEWNMAHIKWFHILRVPIQMVYRRKYKKSNMQSPQAILFDFDGVIAHTQPIMQQALWKFFRDKKNGRRRTRIRRWWMGEQITHRSVTYSEQNMISILRSMNSEVTSGNRRSPSFKPD